MSIWKFNRLAAVSFIYALSISATVYGESFNSDVRDRWFVGRRDNEFWDDVSPAADTAPALTTFSAGQLNVAFVPYDPTGSGTNPNQAGDAATGGLNGTKMTGLSAFGVGNADSGYPNGASNATYYGGGGGGGAKLLGDLSGRAIVMRYKIDLSNLSTGATVDHTNLVSARYGANQGIYDLDANDDLTQGDYSRDTFTYVDPVLADTNAGADYTDTAPEEVRFAVTVRSFTAVAGDSGANESTRWFSEAQAGRMFNTHLDNTTKTMVIPLTSMPGSLFSNYWGYGNAGSGTWGGPSGTAQSNFAAAVSDVDYLRLQIDSSFWGYNGTSIRPDITGDLIIEEFTTILAGDANASGTVTNADIATVFGNFGTTPAGSLGAGLGYGGDTTSSGTDDGWAAGDFNSSGSITNADVAFALGNFGASPAGDITPDAQTADLFYNPATGEVSLTATDATGGVITNFVLENAAGGSDFVPGNFTPHADFNGNFQTATLTEISDSDGGTEGVAGTFSLGAIFPTGLNLTTLESFLTTANYVGQLGSGVQVLDLNIVPEPSSGIVLLMGLVGCGLARRRRAR